MKTGLYLTNILYKSIATEQHLNNSLVTTGVLHFGSCSLDCYLNYDMMLFIPHHLDESTRN